MVERKKFGTKGYNMIYPFSIGDLLCSAAVLKNYMESAPAKVPWADLRYLFGEIMYGGHIVNAFDRLTANTYLDFYMREDILDEMPLFPHIDKDLANIEIFRAPSTGLPYEKLTEHIDEELKTDSPVAFGLHPNAEIGMRTRESDDLLRIILELSSSDSSTSGDGLNSQQVTETLVQEVLDLLRDSKFDIENILMGIEDVGPFQNVVLQECERMNILTMDIVQSLVELDQGFRGNLTMSDKMEELSSSLFLDRVPKRWEGLAYPSLRPLSSWIVDLTSRMQQVSDWAGNPTESPVVAWIGGLFNPQSFITAVMQKTAQDKNLELDKLSLITEVSKKLTAEEISQPAKEGSYIQGLYLEGGSWNLNNALLEPSRPREMYCQLPVINIRPAIIDKAEASLFNCPVYKTQQRGPTFVFSIQLRTKHDTAKWVLSGVVSVLDATS
jgi:dynein heavy chain